MKGLVAIIGRPNVGKSTLFNRLTEENRSIVEDVPGVTRDRIYGTVEWNGTVFTLVDTGGYIPESTDIIEAGVREQALIALEEADAVVFMTDVNDGVTPYDRVVADVLRRYPQKKILAAVNKVDGHRKEPAAQEFYSLGVEKVFPVSAANGYGLGELLDAIVEALQGAPPAVEPELPRISVVGRPNVGKSSFVNALLGRENSLVTPIAGTTRDSVYARYNAFGFDYILIDTAGLRRKAKVKENIEFYSGIRTIRAIQESDVVMLMVSAEAPMEAQDLNILQMIVRARKGLLILVNKWDLVRHLPEAEKEIRRRILERIAPFFGAPILFVSATEKLRIYKAMEKIRDMLQEREKHIPTAQLNDELLEIVRQTPPPSVAGRIVRIKYVNQARGRTPTFVFFANHPQHVKENYRRFLENRIRQLYGFEGWPINVYFREK
ncbi:MAG: ribosome biogenesis GTPase Der [Bacteroidia bacterium]|nr:ribosome biogenesis GTPase Der [Bacteroidia bacterium]MDW8334773.1 ribosome biogenesis GTPase Der [Bacteroidia bacterium]